MLRKPRTAPRAWAMYRAAMKTTCTHLDQVIDVPPGAEVCETCVTMGGTWVHLRQCLVCGLTGCCDSSPNRHASGHARDAGHPILRTLEEGEDWTWCALDDVLMRRLADGAWQAIDPFFDAGLWYARRALEEDGVPLPFAPDLTTPEGFPLGTWATTYASRRRDGTLDPDQARELEGLPGWPW